MTTRSAGTAQRKNNAARRRSNYAYQLKKDFGVTIEWYEAEFAKQGGRCRICWRKSSKRLAVDHDHKCCPGRQTCGKCIRGLICQDCNFRMLGQICQETKLGTEHAINVLLRAAEHLGWNGTRPGMIHAIDRAFMDLAIKERDYYQALARSGEPSRKWKHDNQHDAAFHRGCSYCEAERRENE